MWYMYYLTLIFHLASFCLICNFRLAPSLPALCLHQSVGNKKNPQKQHNYNPHFQLLVQFFKTMRNHHGWTQRTNEKPTALLMESDSNCTIHQFATADLIDVHLLR